MLKAMLLTQVRVAEAKRLVEKWRDAIWGPNKIKNLPMFAVEGINRFQP